MNLEINKSRNFILSIICILFIIFTIIFVSAVSLTRNGLLESNNNDAKVTNKSDSLFGNDIHGYVELTSLWKEVKSSNSDDQSLYFKSRDGYFLSINSYMTYETKAIDLSNYLYNLINNSNYSNVDYTNEMINGMVAYKVVGYNLKTDKWLYSWSFEDNRGKTHIISIEGNDRDSNNYKIPFTYKSKK